MKRLALLATTVLFAGASNAAEITSIITDSVQMTVSPQITITQPITESYTVSGTNIDATTLGSVGNDGVGVYAVSTAGQPFQFSESYQQVGADKVQTQAAGLPDKMTGAISPATGLATGSPGGPGSDLILQRSLELTVLQ